MNLHRWLLLVVIAPGLVGVYVVLFVSGDGAGLKDTPAVRVAFVATALLAALIGWLCARWIPVRHAAWFLPVGAGLAMAAWLPVRRPAALSPAVAAAVILAWICALTFASVLSHALARRRPFGGVLFATGAMVTLVALAPLLAVALGVGSAPLDSVGEWVPKVLSDRTYQLAAQPRQAAEVASMVAVLVMAGTCYVLSYVTRLGAAQIASETDAVATLPETASQIAP
jgi:hypothetical protein